MNENTINELLNQLNTNLQNVESAREQVDAVVKAYGLLSEETKQYTTDLGFIVQNTRTIISQLKEIKKNFRENVSTEIIKEIGANSKELQTKISNVRTLLSSFKSETETHLANITDDISNRATAIDSVLGTVSTNLNTANTCLGKLQTNLTNETTSIKNLLQSIKNNEEEHYSKTSLKVDSLGKTLDTKINWTLIILVINVILTSILLYKIWC